MVEPKTSVSFVCQRCLQPLKLDSSFGNLGEHTLAELSLPIHTAPEVDLESQATTLDHYIPAFGLTESGTGANGFMLVGDHGEQDSLSHRMRVCVCFGNISLGAQVERNIELWLQEMRPKPNKFDFECILSRIADPIDTRGKPIRDPKYIKDVQARRKTK